ncbi:hypothetical protein TRFO_22517 [Tritrichomonas foetus]|uniref:NTF2 domain-containing protein n=1 Tax=Tritrichomonas foetus TaxID=1144522 RepID=A0A1J4KD00_9EUKA|nr:hypothetical protein TRFO_22517 [Tritrichomonas foetus]|eukprot:OHT08850.1 hypothetical protein TRFO_22517 [Tritrichomonas foetus]
MAQRQGGRGGKRFQKGQRENSDIVIDYSRSDFAPDDVVNFLKNELHNENLNIIHQSTFHGFLCLSVSKEDGTSIIRLNGRSFNNVPLFIAQVAFGRLRENVKNVLEFIRAKIQSGNTIDLSNLREGNFPLNMNYFGDVIFTCFCAGVVARRDHLRIQKVNFDDNGLKNASALSYIKTYLPNIEEISLRNNPLDPNEKVLQNLKNSRIRIITDTKNSNNRKHIQSNDDNSDDDDDSSDGNNESNSDDNSEGYDDSENDSSDGYDQNNESDGGYENDYDNNNDESGNNNYSDNNDSDGYDQDDDEENNSSEDSPDSDDLRAGDDEYHQAAPSRNYRELDFTPAPSQIKNNHNAELTPFLDAYIDACRAPSGHDDLIDFYADDAVFSLTFLKASSGSPISLLFPDNRNILHGARAPQINGADKVVSFIREKFKGGFALEGAKYEISLVSGQFFAVTMSGTVAIEKDGATQEYGCTKSLVVIGVRRRLVIANEHMFLRIPTGH